MTDDATPTFATPFGFTSTAADVLADVDLSGRRAVVTGATSGIGVETARALAGGMSARGSALLLLPIGTYARLSAQQNAAPPSIP